MHEALISRGDIRGQEHLTPLIMVEENCVLVCPGGYSPCHKKAETTEGQKIVIRHLFKHIPDTEILHFLEGIHTKMKGTQAKIAINLVQEIRREKNVERENEMSSL